MKTKKTFLNRFIDTIEYWGNKLPHPFMLFGGMLLATLFISWLLARMGVSISYMSASKIPGEPEKLVTVAVVNLLSGDNLRYIIIKFPEIFVSYPPLNLVLVMMAASAFIEKTGFFETFMKKYLLKAPRSLITFAVVFVGINANLMSDAGTIFPLPWAVSSLPPWDAILLLGSSLAMRAPAAVLQPTSFLPGRMHCSRG